MAPSVVRALVVLGFLGIASCAPTRHVACDVSDIGSVFASPTTYLGKRFCGEAYYFGGDEYGGLYDRPVRSMDQRLDTAFLLTARSGHFVGFGREGDQNSLVFVSGLIADVCESAPDVDEQECVPVARAIFLEHYEVRHLRAAE